MNDILRYMAIDGLAKMAEVMPPPVRRADRGSRAAYYSRARAYAQQNGYTFKDHGNGYVSMSGGNGPTRWGQLVDDGKGGFRWNRAEDPYAAKVNSINSTGAGRAAQYGGMIRTMSPDGKREAWQTRDANGNWVGTPTPQSHQTMTQFAAAKTDPQRQAVLNQARARSIGAGTMQTAGNGTIMFGDRGAAQQFQGTKAYANLQRNFQRQRDPGLARAMAGGSYALRGPGKPVAYSGLSRAPNTSFYRGRVGGRRI